MRIKNTKEMQKAWKLKTGSIVSRMRFMNL